MTDAETIELAVRRTAGKLDRFHQEEHIKILEKFADEIAALLKEHRSADPIQEAIASFIAKDLK